MSPIYYDPPEQKQIMLRSMRPESKSDRTEDSGQRTGRGVQIVLAVAVVVLVLGLTLIKYWGRW